MSCKYIYIKQGKNINNYLFKVFNNSLAFSDFCGILLTIGGEKQILKKNLRVFSSFSTPLIIKKKVKEKLNFFWKKAPFGAFFVSARLKNRDHTAFLHLPRKKQDHSPSCSAS
jgi:hypothetical protein